MEQIADTMTSRRMQNRMGKKIEKKQGQKNEHSFLQDLKYDLKHHRALLVMNIPTILFFIVFAYIPMIGIVIAFQDFNPVDGILKSKFVGFDNFKFFLGSDACTRVVFNTLFLNVLFILTGTFMSILIAVMLSEVAGKFFKKVSQSIVILPHFISWTVVALMLEALISTNTGLFNKLLMEMGLQQISFYSNASVWPSLMTFLKIWQGAGYGSIVYLAAITGIDQEIYEAAKIDGATRSQCITHITLPLLKPTIILLLIMSVGGIFNGDFGMIYALVGSNSLLYPTTDVINTYVYRQLMELGDMGMSAAVGLLQSVLGFIMVYITNLIARKVYPDGAIF